MSILTIHDNSCYGLGINIPFTHRRFELWYCPRGYVITPHRHPHVMVRLTALWGCAKFIRIKRTERKDFQFDGIRTMFKTFNIGAEDWHWSERIEKGILFFNNERWLSTPTSASIDFEPMPQQLREKYNYHG